MITTQYQTCDHTNYQQLFWGLDTTDDVECSRPLGFTNHKWWINMYIYINIIGMHLGQRKVPRFSNKILMSVNGFIFSHERAHLKLPSVCISQVYLASLLWHPALHSDPSRSRRLCCQRCTTTWVESPPTGRHRRAVNLLLCRKGMERGGPLYQANGLNSTGISLQF